MIAAIGIDLVDIRKMRRSIRSDAYLRRVFSEAELAECNSAHNRAERLAGKFAAKEAFMKAIGNGIRQGVWFSQIEVLHLDTGQPFLKLSREAQRRVQEMRLECLHLSISHTSGMATAVVILER